ncbi:MAG TPA: hypothetical protein K8V56_10655 [Sporosarcina psychrophila]|uniref:Homeodomain phBC6A51-type domain-containing protein n=1 Tax=Sporosarcina psychrophila TaxID=1476 RepID=A0A921KCY9_SPOPS|nr:hypothetical protein [Sporosarcina psychrophila]
MNIYDELKKLSWKKQAYFKWRFDLEFDQLKDKHTPERLAEILKVKTLNEYTKWEKSPEFLKLTNLVLSTKFANDIEDVYAICVENAKTGDVQSVKMMLELQKQIKQFNTESQKVQKTDDSPYDSLDVT